MLAGLEARRSFAWRANDRASRCTRRRSICRRACRGSRRSVLACAWCRRLIFSAASSRWRLNTSHTATTSTLPSFCKLDRRLEMRLRPAADADEADPQLLVRAVRRSGDARLETAGAAMAAAVAAAVFLINVRRERSLESIFFTTSDWLYSCAAVGRRAGVPFGTVHYAAHGMGSQIGPGTYGRPVFDVRNLG